MKCICDYCGKEYITQYSFYTKSKERGKVSCFDCKQTKIQEILQEKYGVNSVGGSKVFQEKAKQAMVQKYGKKFALQTSSGRKHFADSMKSKYGVENPMLCPDLKEKAIFTAYRNGTIPTSKPEKELVKMLLDYYGKDKCFPCYPVSPYYCDCLLMMGDIKIDIEYDGIYWHKDKEQKDRKRNYFLLNRNYRIIRIKGNNKDTLPTLEQINNAIEYILNENHHLVYINMNN